MKIFITGGAGFIGANCAVYFANQGHDVVVFDSLSRPGSEKNLDWIKKTCAAQFVRGDLRDFERLRSAVIEHGPSDLILHLAAQVAVTTSVLNPREDFEVNAVGTFNLLEAVRQHDPDATIIYASTNKVYGGMEDLGVVEEQGRYGYQDLKEGVDENRNLDFHSPYGCSKGSADQYCRDYFRIYGLKTIVLRQSCIYGYRQFGIEDQGWVAWFCIAVAMGKPITIFGDGKQVRDVLFIDDLIAMFESAYRHRSKSAGKVYNVGGGPENTLSLLELIDMLEKQKGQKIELRYDDWRPGDQKVFVANIDFAGKDLGWRPKVGPAEGVEKLYRWVQENLDLF
jgi:CDP-paratose 2-epimerase